MDVILSCLCCPNFSSVYYEKVSKNFHSVLFHLSFEIFSNCVYCNKFLLMDSSSLHTDRVHTLLSQMCFLLRLPFKKKLNNLPFPKWGHLWQEEIKEINFLLSLAIDPLLSQHSVWEQFEREIFFTQISKANVIEARIVNRLGLLITVDCGKLVVWL